MNYEDVLEGVRINASRGPVWACSRKQAGIMARQPTKLFKKILELDFGLGAGNEWIRECIRLPFFNYLFAKVNYGEFFMRTRPIVSANDLTSGEAMALHDFLFSDEARDVLTEWLHDQVETGEIGIPYSDMLWGD